MTLAQLPEIVNGYELNPGRGWLSVIKPKAATNLIRNPDFERGRQAWVHGIIGNATQLDPVNPGGGAYSLVIHSAAGVGLRLETTAIEGMNGQPDMPTVAGRNYVLSFKYRTSLSLSTDTLVVSSHGSISGIAGYTLSAYLVDGRPMAAIPQSSSWRKVVVVFRESATQSRNIRIATVGSTTNGDIWIDDVQFEEGVEPTTFISGDAQGPAIFDGDYLWGSTPGASSSYRSAKCVAGGEVLNLAKLGFRVTAILGLGLAGQSNVIQSSAYGGGYYSETLTEGTNFQVVGRFDASSPLALSAQRDTLIQALRHDRAGGVSRPVVLRYEMARCNDVLTAQIDIPCVYDGGLEGHVDNLFAEDVVLNFAHYNRDLIAERRAGTPLSNLQTYESRHGVLYNENTDAYSFLIISNVTTLNVVRPGNDGTFWIGGPFTNAGGVGTANYIAKWNPATGAVTGFGAGTVSGVGVDAIFVSRAGYVYAYGQFTQLGGVTTNNLVRYDPTTNAFAAFGSPNGRVRQVVETPGRVYVFGDFTNIGGVAVTGGAWTGDNGTTWNAVSFPIGTVTSALSAAYDPKTNRIYLGAVTSVQSYAGYLDLTTGTATAFIFGASTAVTFPGVFLHPNGSIYMVRSSTAGGTTSGILKVQGNGSVDVATYPAAFTGGVTRTWQDSAGVIHLCTVQTYPLGGINSPAQYHSFDGSRVFASPHYVGGTSYYPIGFYDEFGPYRLWVQQTSIYLGLPGLTTIEDVGSTTPVALAFQGPGLLSSIENVTTGQSIEFNMIVRVGEVITIDTRTGRIMSSVSGANLTGVLSQSSISRWRLVPGTNRIRLRFWPRPNNGRDEYQAVLSGTGNIGLLTIYNASLANTDGGKIYWEVTSGDAGTLRTTYLIGSRVGTIPVGNAGIVATTDLPIQLSGSLDVTPGAGPSAANGVVWYPLAHLYYDDQLAAIDSAAGR